MTASESQAPHALVFDTPDQAATALEQWGEEAARLRRWRDPIVAAAISAGVHRARIARLTGASKTTIDRIRDRGLAPAAGDEVAAEYAAVLDARAERYRASADAARREPGVWDGRAHAARRAARSLREGPPAWAGTGSDDALLLALVIDIEVALATPADADSGFAAGVRQEREQVLGEARALRGRGRTALEDFDPRDREAADQALTQRILASQAESLGLSVEEVAAMSVDELAEAWEQLPDLPTGDPAPPQ